MNESSTRARRPPLLLRLAPEILASCILLAAAALACLPLAIRGPSCGHDFDFHLVSWLEAQHCWREGVFYPRWTASPNFGAGEPRFIFYPPLTWMLGGLLGSVWNWQHAPLALTFLLLSGTGFATQWLARQALPKGAATLAGCLAIFSAYALYTAYERTAYAELAGGFWIPIILLFLLRENKDGRQPRTYLQQAFSPSTALLAVAIAGAWLSNAPLGVMASYLVAAVTLSLTFLKRSWTPIVRTAGAMLLGLSLSAIYLIPAAWEQRWTDIRQAVVDPGERIENSFLFAHHADPALAAHDLELHKVSWIAVATVGLTLAGTFLAWRRKTLPGGRRWWIPLALIAPMVLLLQVPASLFVWNLLPKLRFLQFPWRWLVVVEAPLGIFLASAVWSRSRWKRGAAIGVCGLACVAASTYLAGSFYQVCDPEDSVDGTLSAYRSGTGFEGTDEYAPPGADNSLVPADLPAGCLVSDPQVQLGQAVPDQDFPRWSPQQNSCSAVFTFVAPWQRQHREIRDTVPKPGYLILHLRRFPAWRVHVNGRVVQNLPQRQDGLFAIPVPAGPVDVSLDWVTTSDVRFGQVVSAIAGSAVLGLLGLGLLRTRAHLS